MSDHTKLTELIRDANREITPADRHLILDLIDEQAARIAELEAALKIPDDALPPDGQEWAKVSPEVAFHLIERHGENWAHIGQLMEAWRAALTPATDGQQAVAIYQWRSPSDRWLDISEEEFDSENADRPGQTRIVYTHPASPDSMRRDSERWRIIAQNLPTDDLLDIAIIICGDKGLPVSFTRTAESMLDDAIRALPQQSAQQG